MKTLIARQTIKTADFTILNGDFAKVISEDELTYKIKYENEISYVSKNDEGIKYGICE
jgi:hypothetical protein